jgi:hypothetical protein
MNTGTGEGCARAMGRVLAPIIEHDLATRLHEFGAALVEHGFGSGRGGVPHTSRRRAPRVTWFPCDGGPVTRSARRDMPS